MLKLYSQLVGLPVFEREGNRAVARVLHLILDPERGTVVALWTTRGQVIVPADLSPFDEQGWRVRDEEALIDPKDVVRLGRIPKPQWFLVGKPVVTEDGDRLGKVADYVLEMNSLSLKQLYVIRRALFWPVDKRIIDWKDIVKIMDEAVIVKNQTLSNPERLRDYFRIKHNLRVPMPMPQNMKSPSD